MVNRVDLLTKDSKVSAPSGVVYSTEPHTAESETGSTYFIKGPQQEIVFAELAGCELAREIGVIVPEVAACLFNADVYAGSQAVKDALRDVEPFLSRPTRVTNYSDLYAVAVADIWLANKDRNLGNIIARASKQGATVQFVAIDFEKSAALRPTPTILSAMVPARLLWPSGSLGASMRASRPLVPPSVTMTAISSFTEDRCRAILEDVQTALGNPVPWLDDSIHAVVSRSNRIEQLVEEVWRSL